MSCLAMLLDGIPPRTRPRPLKQDVFVSEEFFPLCTSIRPETCAGRF